MESSGIGASLQELVKTSTRHLVCLGFLMLVVCRAPANLAAQAPSPGHISNSPSLPRFTLREIIAGRNDTLTRIPGRWLQAALAAVPESLAVTAYHEAASRSGLAPLEGSVLASERARHVMGLYRRGELTAGAHRTLEAIRAGLPSDTTRARFDHLFRPRGEWITDLHDAALAWARLRMPGIDWESPRPALTATRWLPANGSPPSSEAVPRALYGLTVLAASDSAAFDAVRSDLRLADSASAAATMVLLAGYTESQRWYRDALQFFMTQPWIPKGGRVRSLADLVQAYWHPDKGGPTETEIIPEIRTRLFGHPQAVPHYSVPRTLFERLVRTDNARARIWLQRYGQVGLLQTLGRLPAGDTSLVLLQTGTEAIRLTTVPRQSRESLNGFLEPRDAIAIDPGYSPLLALGAVVHEWQHLLFRRRQLEAFASRLPSRAEPIVELPGVEPYLAEGFAEWSTELILAPLVERWPLLSLGELQKRAGLGSGSVEDQHATGYALVRTLSAVLPDHHATTELLLRHAEHPSPILSHPAVRRAWSKYGVSRDRLLTLPTNRILIPEVTFTVEDGFPDVVASRILVPPNSKGKR